MLRNESHFKLVQTWLPPQPTAPPPSPLTALGSRPGSCSDHLAPLTLGDNKHRGKRVASSVDVPDAKRQKLSVDEACKHCSSQWRKPEPHRPKKKRRSKSSSGGPPNSNRDRPNWTMPNRTSRKQQKIQKNSANVRNETLFGSKARKSRTTRGNIDWTSLRRWHGLTESTGGTCCHPRDVFAAHALRT